MWLGGVGGGSVVKEAVGLPACLGPAIPTHAALCAPHSRAGSRDAEQQWGIHTFGSSGHSVGYGEGRQRGGEETEKQKAGLSPGGLHAHLAGRAATGKVVEVFSLGTQGPANPPAPSWPACRLPGNYSWPAWASSKPKPCNSFQVKSRKLNLDLCPTQRHSAQELRAGMEIQAA